MADIVVCLAVAAAVFGAGFYVYKAVKKGKSCIGCPYNGNCDRGCGVKHRRE